MQRYYVLIRISSACLFVRNAGSVESGLAQVFISDSSVNFQFHSWIFRACKILRYSLSSSQKKLICEFVMSSESCTSVVIVSSSMSLSDYGTGRERMNSRLAALICKVKVSNSVSDPIWMWILLFFTPELDIFALKSDSILKKMKCGSLVERDKISELSTHLLS